MANGNGTALTPAKTIGICLALSVAVNSLALGIVQQYQNQIDDLRHELDRRTDQRYRQSDADRDFRLVEYRFSRNEANIEQCLEHIKEHQ